MPDIITSQVFSDGEKGITATKMNNIIANAVIDPSFVTAKPSSSTLDPTDQLLEVKGAGTYARITGQQLIDSVSASVTQNIQPTIWSVRLRSVNVAGNPNFLIDQANVNAGHTNLPNGGRMVDRWLWGKVGTHTVNSSQPGESIFVPNTSYLLNDRSLTLTLGTQQTTLAAGDYGYILQQMEGSQLRPLFNDVHSVSILIKSSVANLKFSYWIQDPNATHTYTKLCTLGATNTWTLITVPNIPAFVAGSWSVAPGIVGAIEGICFGAGSSMTSSSDGAWLNSGAVASPGTTNFFGSTVGATVSIGFIQHEPGALCSTLMDKPFTQNYDECLRYYQKTYAYGTAIGTINAPGYFSTMSYGGNAATQMNMGRAFVKPMAKIPTVTIYNLSTGAANSVSDYTGVARAVSSLVDVSDKQPFGTLSLAVAAAGGGTQPHYTSDTGW